MPFLFVLKWEAYTYSKRLACTYCGTNVIMFLALEKKQPFAKRKLNIFARDGNVKITYSTLHAMLNYPLGRTQIKWIKNGPRLFGRKVTVCNCYFMYGIWMFYLLDFQILLLTSTCLLSSGYLWLNHWPLLYETSLRALSESLLYWFCVRVCFINKACLKTVQIWPKCCTVPN